MRTTKIFESVAWFLSGMYLAEVLEGFPERWHILMFAVFCFIFSGLLRNKGR